MVKPAVIRGREGERIKPIFLLYWGFALVLLKVNIILKVEIIY